MMRNSKIIVCCHKHDIFKQDELFLPIQVGKALSEISLGIQGDDVGDNISLKNRSYCELTGMYWAWKNLKNIDVIGLCHYRRYFDFNDQCDSVMPETCFQTKQFNEIDLSIPPSVFENLSDSEAYVVKPRFYRSSLYLDYCRVHISDDIYILEQLIMNTQPPIIKRAWIECMHRNCQLSHYNMFIMTWRDFDSYCSWLFPLLRDMEQRIDISCRDFEQGRVWGFMAERLFNVWLLANHFKIHEKPLIWFNDYPSNSSRSHFKYYFNLLRSKIALFIVRKNIKISG